MEKLVKVLVAVATMACIFAFVGCEDPATEPTSGSGVESYDRNEWQIEGSAVVKYLGTATDVVIPNGVTYITSYAFEDRRDLKNLTIPASLMGFGEYTFAWFDLETVQYGGTFTQWCAMDRPMGCTITAKSVKLSDGTDLKSLTTLVIPNGVTRIGCNTFEGYDKLTSVMIPVSVTDIGYGAFASCNGLAVQYAGNLAQWCTMYNDFFLMEYEATSIKLSDVDDLRSITSLVIPDGVTSIGGSAFYGCNKLTSVTIPASVEKIGSNAFSKCDSLTTVTYGGTLAQWCAMDNDYCIMDYNNEKNIKLSDGTDLRSLTSLDIPNGVTRIGYSAFHNCDNLTSITIPASVTDIGREAFKDCDRLTSVTIPVGVKSIEYGVFQDCRDLTSVTIPVSVKKIGNQAFDWCKKLETVQYGGTKAEWDNISKDGDIGLKGKTITGSDGSTWTA